MLKGALVCGGCCPLVCPCTVTVVRDLWTNSHRPVCQDICVTSLHIHWRLQMLPANKNVLSNGADVAGMPMNFTVTIFNHVSLEHQRATISALFCKNCFSDANVFASFHLTECSENGSPANDTFSMSVDCRQA